MADKVKDLASAKVTRNNIGQFIYELKTYAESSRRQFERHWYDNNFFDDGYHFRYMSRSQGKVMDLSEKASIYNPYRAIPKASRQIRGVSNLLISPRYVPVVYPEKLLASKYTPEEFEEIKKATRDIAKKSGHWVEQYVKKLGIMEKLAFMVILTAKNGISYMEIWPDAVKEEIKCQVYDAFDIYLQGDLTEIYDSPFISKAVPRLVEEIRADERFDPEQVEKITPDNRLASSDIKEAYAKARFSGNQRNSATVSVIQNETFIKEYLNDQVRLRIEGQENAQEVLEGKKSGDMVIRQVFTAGNIWLRDEYVKLSEYPFVEFRMEPGPIYQVPLIERFIPVNKSLDMAVSRLERFFHTMNTGAWLKRQGEQVNFDNRAGGQVIEYANTPPVQAQIASPSAMSFPFLQFLSGLIEEQGVSTSTLGKLPSGVRANAAIESLKESEYATLQIAQDRLKMTVKRIAETLLDYADDYFVSPQAVQMLNRGEPEHFDVIGGNALKKRKKLDVMDGIEPGTIALKGDYLVDIQIEQGLAFTSEGKKKRAKEIMDSMLPYVQNGFISSDAFKLFLQNWLETWEFGPVSDVMQSMETSELTDKMTEEKITQVKIAVLEALKEAGEIGPEAQKNRILENKVGVLEALKESGLAKHMTGGGEGTDKGPSESISFKDLPPGGKVQMAAKAGIELDEGEISQDEQADLVGKVQDMQLKQGEHEMKMAQSRDNMTMKQAQAQQQMELRKKAMKGGGKNASSKGK